MDGKKRKSRVRANKKRAPKNGITKPSKSFVANVKKVMHKVAEKKLTSTDPTVYIFNGNGTNNSVVSSAVEVSSAVTLIPQGTGQGARIGNKINVTKAQLNGVLVFDADNELTPQFITIFIGYQKSQRGVIPTAGAFALLLQDGDASIGMDNTVLSMLRSVNRDFFTISSRKEFKLGNAGTAFALSNNNDFPLVQRFRINLKAMLGNTVFSDLNANSNKELYMWCQYTDIYGAVLPIAQSPTFSYYIDIEFDDL